MIMVMVYLYLFNHSHLLHSVNNKWDIRTTELSCALSTIIVQGTVCSDGFFQVLDAAVVRFRSLPITGQFPKRITITYQSPIAQNTRSPSKLFEC